MLSGDLWTMSLADILQWADASSMAGTLTLERETGEMWLRIKDHAIVAASEAPARAVPVDVLSNSERPVPQRLLQTPELAVEMLYDQFLDSDDSFRFEEGTENKSPGVELNLPIQPFVMEGLRHLDEWPYIDVMYSSDVLRLHSAEEGPEGSLRKIQRALLELAKREVTLSEARLTLGASRPAMLRNVEALRRLGRITVDGTPAGGDLIAKLIDQATILLRERQFDEAQHVFSALLSADPSAARIKGLLRAAEREQLKALYAELPRDAVVSVIKRDTPFDQRRLSRTDRELLERVNGRWDVGTLVLVSPLREVETLKSLQKLRRLHVIQLARLRPASKPSQRAVTGTE